MFSVLPPALVARRECIAVRVGANAVHEDGHPLRARLGSCEQAAQAGPHQLCRSFIAMRVLVSSLLFASLTLGQMQTGAIVQSRAAAMRFIAMRAPMYLLYRTARELAVVFLVPLSRVSSVALAPAPLCVNAIAAERVIPGEEVA